MRRQNGYLTAGLILAGLTAALILLGFFWTPWDPNAMSADRSGPSLAHLMGTDNFGRDILSRVMKGAGTTASIALATVAIGAGCGTVIGALTGYFGGIVDEVLMRINDALTAFPSVLLALVVMFSVWAVGVLLVTAMLIVPAATARNLARTAGGMFWWALLAGVSSGFAGLALSAQDWLATASGATVILVSCCWFAASCVWTALRGRRRA